MWSSLSVRELETTSTSSGGEEVGRCFTLVVLGILVGFCIRCFLGSAVSCYFLFAISQVINDKCSSCCISNVLQPSYVID
jgi:hypothetical protein